MVIIKGWVAVLAIFFLVAIDAYTKLEIHGPTYTDHYRGTWWSFATPVLAALTILILFIAPSMRFPALLVCAGAIGNVSSALITGHIPNPFLLERGDVWVAFNVADVVLYCGIVALLVIALFRGSKALLARTQMTAR